MSVTAAILPIVCYPPFHQLKQHVSRRLASPDFPSIERFEMRSFLLCIILLAGLSSPVFGQQAKAITNSIGMKLVLIHAGSFTMGSPVREIGREENETQHEVTISKSYYLGSYEVTQGQYEKVIGKNPSHFKGSDLPVEWVAWNDAVFFCGMLSDIPEEKATGREYRLPTEAEWEYACRATSGSAYCFGDSEDSLGEYAWFGELRGLTHPVGEKKANRWGLYDMYGNVSEWCQDRDSDYQSGVVTDPQGPNKGQRRVARGGDWSTSAEYCRSARRFLENPRTESNGKGFRVVLNMHLQLPESASSK